MSTETLGMDEPLRTDNPMMLDPLGLDSVLPNSELILSPPGMDYSWNAGNYPDIFGNATETHNTVERGFQSSLCEGYDQSRLADTMSSFSHIQPAAHQNHSPTTTVNPANMSGFNKHTATSAVSSYRSSQISSPLVKIEDGEGPKPTLETALSPAESDSSPRARHAARERHSKAQKARRDSQQSDGSGSVTDKKARLRAKNKVAAAKCRQRQRMQAQSIQDKGGRLSEANAQLKASVQELRGQLNGLRAMALYHQGCNCQVARYNYEQAERLATEYNSTFMGHLSPLGSDHMGGQPT